VIELFECRPQEIDHAWRNGASELARATKWASREITPDQLKMLLSRGERTLIGAREAGTTKAIGWASVAVQQLPNIRVLHVFAMAGKGIASPEVMTLIGKYAEAHGCSSVRGAVRPSMARLLSLRGWKPVYATWELEVVL
jgi:hypothetical protein